MTFASLYESSQWKLSEGLFDKAWPDFCERTLENWFLKYFSESEDWTAGGQWWDKKGENEIVFTLQPEAKVLIDKYMSRNGHLQFGKYSSYKQIYSLVFRHINKVTELSGVKKKVTYYSARKTFAQHGYDLGIQIEKIEYCIGHSMKNNRPIFNYIKIMQEHADKVFRAVLDQLL